MEVFIYREDEVKKDLAKLKIPAAIMEKTLAHKVARYENHEDLDIVCIPKSLSSKTRYNAQCIHVFIKKDSIIFVGEETKELTSLLEKSKKEVVVFETWRVLYDVFERMLDENQRDMEQLEANIMNLEDEILLSSKEIKPMEKIVEYRKRLLSLKRYYEQLVNIFSYIIANENLFFGRKSLRYFKIQGEKVNRLYQSVLVMRDYVTQIREAYQSEVDISLNKTMKLFTVVATIFMPLTLVVGWYGMNFDMPEFHWAYGYQLVMGISAICIVSCIYFFKRKKWF